MRKVFLLFITVFSFILSVSGQRKMENLDRGLIAAKTETGIYLNWRIPGQEWEGVSYNIYRNGQKINESPITGASNYTDNAGSINSTYQIAAIVNDTEQSLSKSVSVLANPWIEIAMRSIPKIEGVADSYYNQYTINDATAADLDGDGEYEIIIKRVNEGYDPADPFANKYYSLIEAYKLDGTHLWTINVGPNIIFNVEINVLAYDFDGDGKAEIIMRSSEGTIDGKGNIIGDVGNADGGSTPDGITNYRNTFVINNSWFETKGPEFLSLYDGETGEELDRINYIARQPFSQWGPPGSSDGQLAHRACKFMFGAPYLNGKTPSVFISRGIYYRTKMATYDVVNKKFVKKWDWDSGTGEYCGQGNHNFSIADVDNDGCDEIIYGSMTIDHDGKGLYSTGLGHGDAIHVGDFDPYRKGLEVFACLEDSPHYGTTLRAAEDGKILLKYVAGRDCGRCCAANVSDSYKGAELWPSQSGAFSASERKEITLPGGYSSNFRIYWDGDLLEELLDHNWNSSLGKGTGVIQKLSGGKWNNILEAGYYSCNHTKGTPCLQADLFGDWREEVIWRSPDDSKIRIYFSTHPTEHRIYSLMHDHQYRQAIAWQICGYNQPPHTSFFLGENEGILLPPPPVMDNNKLVYTNGANWDKNSANWKKDGISATYSNGENVLFDVSGKTSETIMLNTNLSPGQMTVNSTHDYAFDMSAGKLSGTMKLIKQGPAALTFNGTHDYSGVTEIWDGKVVFDGTLSNSPVWLNFFAEMEASGSINKGMTLNYSSVLYPGGKSTTSSLKIGSSLILKDNSIIEFDLSSPEGNNDGITIEGNLTMEGKIIFRLNKLSEKITSGEYNLLTVNGDINNNAEIKTEGYSETPVSVNITENKVILTVTEVRSPGKIIWEGSQEEGRWDFAGINNFKINGNSSYFVSGDEVTFDNSSSNKTVKLQGELSPAKVEVNTDATYTFSGTGEITGDASLTVSGSGKLIIENTHKYTGNTLVKEGATLEVNSLPNLENQGATGYVKNTPEAFVLDGGTMRSAGKEITTTQPMKIGAGEATIEANKAFIWNAPISGTTLNKTGNETLTVSGTNGFDKLVIKAGTVILNSEETNPGKTVVFENGTLSCYNNIYSYSGASWNIEVAEGNSGTINFDGRCDYTGRLTGSGNLTIMSPWIRSYLKGNWSAFTGTLTATTDSDGGDLSFDNSAGLPNARLHISGALNVFNNAGSFRIGALSSNSRAVFTGNHAWIIGSKNMDATFEGSIKGGSVTKTGTGTQTFTNVNTYTGTTTINQGRLLITNKSGSGTGSGTVYVNAGGILAGSGIVDGAVQVYSGGIIEPGNHTSESVASKQSVMRFKKSLTLMEGSTLQMSMYNASGASMAYDKLSINGSLLINSANLIIEIINDDQIVKKGTEMQIFSTPEISGSFASIQLPEVEEGAAWDLSDLYTSGIIRVGNLTSIKHDEIKTFNVYPNPVNDILYIQSDNTGEKITISDISGTILVSRLIENAVEEVSMTAFNPGVYILKIKNQSQLIIKK